jgi:16S rRNA (uracil1498-N3)-methyltransferase
VGNREAPRVHADLPLHTGAAVSLPEAASHHLLRVLRLRPGAAITLFNGRGGQYLCRLAGVAGRCAQVEVGAFENPPTESALATHLALALSRGERLDLALQKAVELGVSRVTLLATEHCALRLAGESLSRRLSHWRAVIVAACEQCGRNRVPELAPPLPFARFVDGPLDGVSLLLHPGGERLADLGPQPGAVTLVSGPEGGFSDREVDLARAAGLRVVSLGPRVLRAETAPLAALALVQHLYGDL